MCHVFLPLVSIFGLFPVLVKCDHWLILVQPCLSNYLWFTCVFIVLSFQFDFVWSTRYSRCFLSALSCPVSIKDYYLSLRPRLRVLVPPCCVHCDRNLCCMYISWTSKMLLVTSISAVISNRVNVLFTFMWSTLQHNCNHKNVNITETRLNVKHKKHIK